ncbi:MAG: HAMP domain-containing histidine kinase [Clostridiales bacterium]|nr:HAMP domain-containing histidine kinase [Clostridiales bacterium]
MQRSSSYKVTFRLIISYIILVVVLNAFYYVGIKIWVNNDHVKKLENIGQFIIYEYTHDNKIDLNNILSSHGMEYYLYDKDSKALLASNSHIEIKYGEHIPVDHWKDLLKYDSPRWFYYETVFSDEMPIILILRENAVQTNKDMVFLWIIGIITSIVLVLLLWSQSSKRAQREYELIAEITRKIQSTSPGDLSVRLGMDGKGELKEFISAFNRMMENIEQKDKKRKRMLHALLEKMNIPASIILGYTKMFAQEGEQNVQKRKAILSIRREAQNITSLLESFISSILEDTELLSNETEEFEIGDLIREIVQENKLYDESHYFDVTINSNEIISGDREKIKEAFRILLSNSMEICPEGHIALQTLHTQRDAVVVIENAESQKGLSNIIEKIKKTDSTYINPVLDKIYLGHVTAETILKYYGGQILLENNNRRNTLKVIIPKHGLNDYY